MYQFCVIYGRNFKDVKKFTLVHNSQDFKIYFRKKPILSNYECKTILSYECVLVMLSKGFKEKQRVVLLCSRYLKALRKEKNKGLKNSFNNHKEIRDIITVISILKGYMLQNDIEYGVVALYNQERKILQKEYKKKLYQELKKFKKIFHIGLKATKDSTVQYMIAVGMYKLL